MEPQFRFCTSADGARIAYAIYGSGPPPLHPGPIHFVMEELFAVPESRAYLDALAARVTLVTFDWRGAGASARDADDVSQETEALDIAAVADAAGLGEFTLFAHGVPAQACARYFSDDRDALFPMIVAPAMVLQRERWPRQESMRVAGLMPNAQVRFVPGDGYALFPRHAPVVEAVFEFMGLNEPTMGRAGGTRTVLFTDIVGHTEMMQRLGDAKGRDVLREHERITRDLLKQHGGAEVKTMGDGFMASFGSVTSAMECAIALQRAFAAHTAGTSTGADAAAPRTDRSPDLSSPPEPLHVRVGLNAGEPIEEDGDLFGSTVILASRIAAKAGAGEILVPDTVRGLLSGKGFVFGDRGEFVPKGFDEGIRLWDVRWQPEPS